MNNAEEEEREKSLDVFKKEKGLCLSSFLGSGYMMLHKNDVHSLVNKHVNKKNGNQTRGRRLFFV